MHWNKLKATRHTAYRKDVTQGYAAPPGGQVLKVLALRIARLHGHHTLIFQKVCGSNHDIEALKTRLLDATLSL